MTSVFARWIRLNLTVLLVSGSQAWAFERGEALVVFHVVDETDEPVHEAEVRCTAWWPGTAWALPQRSRKFEGMTDQNGAARASITAYHDMACRFRKTGYYDTRFRYSFRDKAKPPLVGGQWQPWGRKQTVVLKRVINPIAMYVRSVDEPVPVLRKSVGHDLEKGDWVVPYGRGRIADLVLTVDGTARDIFDKDIDMVLTFSNEADGIASFSVPPDRKRPVGGRFASAHEAPLTGYEQRNVHKMRLRPRRADRVNASSYPGMIHYFRVRTVRDRDGNIKKAWYGKMYGDLRCRFRGREQIHACFTYYLNPTGTRNVEFDTRRNLFKRQPRGYVVYGP